MYTYTHCVLPLTFFQTFKRHICCPRMHSNNLLLFIHPKSFSLTLRTCSTYTHNLENITRLVNSPNATGLLSSSNPTAGIMAGLRTFYHSIRAKDTSCSCKSRFQETSSNSLTQTFSLTRPCNFFPDKCAE